MSQNLKEKYVLKISDKDLSNDVPMSQKPREASLEDQRQRSQQQCANETEAQRQVRLLDHRQRDHERRASESEEQSAQQNERLGI